MSCCSLDDLHDDPRWIEGLRLLEQLQRYMKTELAQRRAQLDNILLHDRLRHPNI